MLYMSLLQKYIGKSQPKKKDTALRQVVDLIKQRKLYMQNKRYTIIKNSQAPNG